MDLQIPYTADQWAKQTGTGLMALSAAVTALAYQIRHDDPSALKTARDAALSLGMLSMWLEQKQ